MSFLDYLNILRPAQWYKNLLVFLAAFFSANLFNTHALWLSLIGFVSLCLASSASYIINDLADKTRDEQNPEKKHRPIAAGRISTTSAIVFSIILLLTSITIAHSISYFFTALILTLIALNQAYTFWLKHIILADIFVIGSNFVLRAVSGAIIISVFISPWLVLCPFFLALFLASGKRYAETKLLAEKARHARPVLEAYTPKLTKTLLIITTSALIISYTVYAFQRNIFLLYTLPFALYVIIRYLFLIITAHKIARHPELAVKDWQLMLGIGLWIVSALAAIYG
ncbi:MAG: decaprenyl-phosphate phosphoribosyltransferase [Candidatus Woesearchaeota archaeon]|nr:decaprenyl-phosphate phosphoribosyltransferase [Candidatus Woesearchaeota archaeon]